MTATEGEGAEPAPPNPLTDGYAIARAARIAVADDAAVDGMYTCKAAAFSVRGVVPWLSLLCLS